MLMLPYLSGENKVGIHGYGGSIRDKVGDRFHDIP